MGDTGMYQTRRPVVKPSWPAISAAPAPVARHSAAGSARAPSIRPPRPPNGAAWSSVETTGTSATKGFTAQTSGEYQYRVRACNTAGCSGWSATKMVLVSRPPTVGFDSTYVVRSGDLGSDGDTDIYLSPLAVGTGKVGEFILKNNGGTFALENSPSVAELASAQSWSVSTSLEIVLEDVNVDGIWDAFVTGISGGSGFVGGVDQIVVAPATAAAKPTGLVAVDDDLKSFIDSVMAWYVNLSHFDKTITAQTRVLDGATTAGSDLQIVARYRRNCVAEWVGCVRFAGKLADYYGSTLACVAALASGGFVFRNEDGSGAILPMSEACGTDVVAFFGIAQNEMTIKDFSNVAVGAVENVDKFIKIWETGATSYEIEDLADVLEDVLEVRIGGIFDDRLDEVQQGLFNIYALFGAQGRKNVDVPANRVIVTKRRVRGLKWAILPFNWHAVLEFPLTETYGVLGYNPTIAAYNVGDVNTGKLVNRRNDISERNNLFAGIVTLEPENFVSVWVSLSASDRKYCKNLDYAHPFQSDPIGPDEYNSNGYIAGIINSIAGSTNAPISSFYLGHKPVPVSEFQRSTCN